MPGGSDEMPDWDAAAGELAGPVISRVKALTPESFATIEAPELEALLAGLSHVATDLTAPVAARTAAEDHLKTIYARYEVAINNEQIKRAMGPSLNQALKAHLDGTGVAGINAARTAAGLTTHIELVPAIATAATAAIAGRISADGTVT